MPGRRGPRHRDVLPAQLRAREVAVDLSLERIEAAAGSIDPVFLNTPQFVDERLSAELGREVAGQGRDAQSDRQLQGTRDLAGGPGPGSGSHLGLLDRRQLRTGPGLRGRERGERPSTCSRPSTLRRRRSSGCAGWVPRCRSASTPGQSLETTPRRAKTGCSWSTGWIRGSPRAPERSGSSSDRRAGSTRWSFRSVTAP